MSQSCARTVKPPVLLRNTSFHLPTPPTDPFQTGPALITTMAAPQNDQYEPLLAENMERFTMFPIKYPLIWEASGGSGPGGA